jgi:7-cyano-7-deazaguanine synthase
MNQTADKAVVLFSGGQDSTTCLAWALTNFASVETVTFDYGQRHAVELQCQKTVLAEIRQQFPPWTSRLGADRLIDLHVLNELSENALTRDVRIEMDESGLPTTFVPGRNILFFTMAGIVAYGRGANNIVGGMCETDFSGYPDCRDDAIKATQIALNLGMDARFILHTPLMWRDKAATWRLADDLGGSRLIDLIREHTHTCYLGDRSQRHEWGYGCGQCPACELRARGYANFLRTGSAVS